MGDHGGNAQVMSQGPVAMKVRATVNRESAMKS
jgi:hypothetical protein